MSAEPTGAPVPREWTRLVEKHHFARIDRDLMRNGATQQQRDEAAIRYGRAVEQIMDDLDTLSDQKQLGRMTLLLARKERK